MLKLSQELIKFQCKWNELMAKHFPISPENKKVDQTVILEFLGLCKDFLIEIQTIIEFDTKEWIRNFKNNLEELERSVPSKTNGNDDQKNKPITNT